MPQVFHPSMNTVARVSIFGALGFVAAAIGLAAGIARSPWATDVGVVRDQPVPFSHEHHVGEIGIDCRYCHASVASAPFAGMPSSEVCMDCHSQLWTEAEILEPVRRSYATGEPLKWTRVHDLPDYVCFDHSIHVHKGVACSQCHGEVDKMPLMYQAETLHMQWCLDCHRDPAAKVGTVETQITVWPEANRFVQQDSDSTTRASLAGASAQAANTAAESPHSEDAGPALKSKTNCSVCHR